MFSRRHPYLFFILCLSALLAFTMLGMGGVFLIVTGYSGLGESEGERVGVIEITGTIAESRRTLEVLKRFREDESIKAIVLRINSPGGGVGASQEIFQAVRRTVKEKKIISSMGGVAASGGYYIAAGTSGIVANPGTITGSIGVIMGYTNFGELIRKIGLKPVVIKSGQYKDTGSPLREMSEKERELLQSLVRELHQQFIRHVSQGREMEMEQVEKLADGRIFTGEQAKSLGLVDRLGNLEDAVEWAGRLGGIKGDIQTVYPKKKRFSLLEFLLGVSWRKLAQEMAGACPRAAYLWN